MEALLEKEKLERLRRALTELPEQMQRCVRLRVAEDRSYQEIADSLGVSINTVKTHVRSILRKLSASRRNEAVRRARALGLI